ncbi:HAAS signaling domain-containing protein [Bacillus sp. Hm123]|uniref:HAAS signaling domain-containing protein n=1 Tax=Bacillus sp. Hm123 TaxID=3450745 RepID=UPI003F43E2E7
MKNDEVKRFLSNLNKELSHIPKSERDNYIHEFEDHLTSLIEDKKSTGMTEKEAIESSLNEFPSPKIVAKDLVDSHEKLFKDPTEGMDFKFRYKSALIVMGLGELALLFIDQSTFIRLLLG